MTHYFFFFTEYCYQCCGIMISIIYSILNMNPKFLKWEHQTLVVLVYPLTANNCESQSKRGKRKSRIIYRYANETKLNVVDSSSVWNIIKKSENTIKKQLKLLVPNEERMKLPKRRGKTELSKNQPFWNDSMILL